MMVHHLKRNLVHLSRRTCTATREQTSSVRHPTCQRTETRTATSTSLLVSTWRWRLWLRFVYLLSTVSLHVVGFPGTLEPVFRSPWKEGSTDLRRAFLNFNAGSAVRKGLILGVGLVHMKTVKGLVMIWNGRAKAPVQNWQIREWMSAQKASHIKIATKTWLACSNSHLACE